MTMHHALTEDGTRLMTAAEASEFLTETLNFKISKRTLEEYRCKMIGPDYWEVGSYKMYREDELLAWAKSKVKKVTIGDTA